MDEPFGRYRLRGSLGAGGMGQVFRAYDTELDREVAIKVLPAQLGTDATFEQRFRLEARTAAALGEPHVVPIYDSGEIDGRLYIAMQLIDGTDLATVLRERGPLSPAEAVDIVEQVAAALDAAHAATLVHRDVKPANLIVTDTGFVYLIDFGIAHTIGQATLTGTGAIGTLPYMAPERFTTGVVDRRADIYALACVLYECLTATTPYPAISIEQQMYAHVNGPVPKPCRARPGLPRRFDDVIARGLAADPQRRYDSAGELAVAARVALKSAPHRLGRLGRLLRPGRLRRPTVPVAAQTPATAAPGAPGSLWPRRAGLATATALCIVVPVAGFTVARHHRPAAPAAPTLTAATARTVTATIPVGKGPWGVALDDTTGTAYITNGDDNTVSVIDLNRNTVTGTVTVGQWPHRLAVDPITRTAYTTNFGDDTVSVIDTATNTVSATVHVGQWPNGITVDPASHAVYTTNEDDTVSVIDGTTRAVTATIRVGKRPHRIVIDPTTHTAYTTNNSDNTVSVIDLATNTVATTIGVGPRPHGIAVDPGAHTLYTTNTDDNTVSVIDTATNTVTATIAVGRWPQAVAVDPTIHTAYTANASDNSVSVIDTLTNTVTATVSVGDGPPGIAVDPASHAVYVTNSGDNTVSVIRPAP